LQGGHLLATILVSDYGAEKVEDVQIEKNDTCFAKSTNYKSGGFWSENYASDSLIHAALDSDEQDENLPNPYYIYWTVDT